MFKGIHVKALAQIYGHRSAGQSNNGKFKHEYAFVTGLRRYGSTRMKQDDDESE
jgi:hypothetical protein